MGKAYLFIPTGEVRKPNSGEAVLQTGPDGTICIVTAVNCSFDRWPVGVLYEVHIPPDADECALYFSKNRSTIGASGTFPIPRPKKKVKKWQWLVKWYESGNINVLPDLWTKDGLMRALGDSVEIICPIEETMIEVDQ
ncbi:MAG: hypothetical protein PHY29_02870 [Syntrophales bacterium]|nr:hypothetical protein [Syntrophales bacterium]